MGALGGRQERCWRRCIAVGAGSSVQTGSTRGNSAAARAAAREATCPRRGDSPVCKFSATQVGEPRIFKTWNMEMELKPKKITAAAGTKSRTGACVGEGDMPAGKEICSLGWNDDHLVMDENAS